MLLFGTGTLALPLVSFSAPAAPASRLLPELGKAMGLRLEAGSPLAREVLLVSVREVNATDLLKRLATVTGGEWEEKDGVYRLALSGPLAAKEARDERIVRGETWRAQVRQQQTQRKAGHYSDGQNGVAEAIVARLPAEMLGGLGFKERIVYSTRPTRMQRPLPVSMLAGIDLTKLGAQSIMRMGDGALPAVASVACVQFTIQADEAGSTLYHSLAVADATGRVFRGEAGQIMGYSIDREPKEGWPTLPRPDASVKLTKEERERALRIVAVDPIENGMNQGEGESSEGRSSLRYSRDELNKLSPVRQVPEALQPEIDEPLALVAGPLLARFAEGQSQNIVADIPDGAFHGAALLAREAESSAANFLRSARWQMRMTLQKDEGWVLGRPLRPAFARASRLDRRALGKALRTLGETGTLSLESQAEFAQAAPLVCGEEMLDAPMFAIVRPDFGRRILSSPSSGERQLLRLYRALGAAGTGKERPFGSLPSPVRESLADLVFNGLIGPSHTTPATLNGQLTSWTPPSDPHFLPSSLDQERTVYWGDGVPANARFLVGEGIETATFGLAPNGMRPRMSENEGGYGMRGSGNGTLTVYTPLPRLERYAKGFQRRIAFTLNDDKGTTFRRVLESSTVPADASVIAYADLPEALRKRIEDNEAEIQKALSDPDHGFLRFGRDQKNRP